MLIISRMIFVIFQINFVKLTFNFISFEETGIVTIDFGEIAEESGPPQGGGLTVDGHQIE